ncbi:MAG: cyclic nucleotide-binding domain-containing protein [Actinomycetota bacterium]|nr:cyclic nucleotide-binding domain-containing protein [Actinomycetota bacterium]
MAGTREGGPRGGWQHAPSARGARSVVKRGIAEREAALATIPLFADLSKRHIRELARACGVAEYGEGETVVKQDAAGDVCYLILEGQARVMRNGRRLATIASGSFFGEMSLLDGAPRTASVITDEPSRLLSLPRQAFIDLLATNPSIASKVLATVARRLRAQERPLIG